MPVTEEQYQKFRKLYRHTDLIAEKFENTKLNWCDELTGKIQKRSVLAILMDLHQLLAADKERHANTNGESSYFNEAWGNYNAFLGYSDLADKVAEHSYDYTHPVFDTIGQNEGQTLFQLGLLASATANALEYQRDNLQYVLEYIKTNKSVIENHLHHTARETPLKQIVAELSSKLFDTMASAGRYDINAINFFERVITNSCSLATALFPDEKGIHYELCEIKSPANELHEPLKSMAVKVQSLRTLDKLAQTTGNHMKNIIQSESAKIMQV